MKDEIGSEAFESLVSEALSDLPEDLAERMSNVHVVVESAPDQDLADELGTGIDGLLGLYQGVPLTNRENYYWVLPDRITLYRDNIMSIARDADDLREIVRKTVIHEVAHHFGIDDSRLEELGWA